MENSTATVKAGITAAILALTGLWGWVGWLTIIFILAMFFDVATGFAVAMKEGKWSSSVAFKGLWKKLGSIVIIVCAALFDIMIMLAADAIPALNIPDWYSGLAYPLVTIWCALTEMGSILENAGGLGAQLPDFFVKAIKILKKDTEIMAEKLEGEKETE